MVKPRILVVDDDPDMIVLVEEILSLVPCQVLAASDGEEGLARLREELQHGNLVDAVLLDVKLPGSDGFDILQQIKADPRLEQIPILMVTGLREAQDKARGLQMGADDYVTKPFDAQELLARINAVLRIRRTEQMLRRRNQELAALNEINRMVSASLELDQVLVSALAGLERLVTADALAIVLNDEETREWVVRTSHSPEGVWLEGRNLPLAGDAAREALQKGHSVFQTTVEDGFWSEALGITPVDLLYVPLIIHDEPVGLLAVLGRAGSLNRDYLPLLEHMAAGVSVAVENARLYGELTAFAEELERSQSQLVQAEKMAAVGRLTASIAHEINNPLQAIQTSLHLTVHPNLDEAGRRRYLGIAQEEMRRLVQIVRRMLDFYRPASSMACALDLNRAVQDALAIANKKLQQAHIQVSVRLAPDLPPVWGSANQLSQVFLNIIINALEAMNDGGKLWVGTAYHAERDQVVAAFRDSGTGITPEVREHFFEPFHTTKTNGTGLGLAISYGIVKRHKGTIEVESTPGEGATFIVCLPQCYKEF
jgi:signal transduction histidine kinase